MEDPNYCNWAASQPQCEISWHLAIFRVDCAGVIVLPRTAKNKKLPVMISFLAAWAASWTGFLSVVFFLGHWACGVGRGLGCPHVVLLAMRPAKCTGAGWFLRDRGAVQNTKKWNMELHFVKKDESAILKKKEQQHLATNMRHTCLSENISG